MHTVKKVSKRLAPELKLQALSVYLREEFYNVSEEHVILFVDFLLSMVFSREAGGDMFIRMLR
jgi:hypothetical protein